MQNYTLVDAHYYATWTEENKNQFIRTQEEFEQIDKELGQALDDGSVLRV